MAIVLPLGAVQGAWGHAWSTGGWGWFPGVLLCWVVVTALVAYLVTRIVRHSPPHSRSARDILAERFARGEMDAEEYEDRLSHLA